jgi:hypothetical protein
MRNSTMRASLIFAATLTVLSTGAWAQSSGGCARPPVFAKLPDAMVARFKANPQALLATYASAGLPHSTQVRGLLLSDPNLIDALIDAAKNGNDAQKAAIGAGLAQASQILVCTNPQIAATIQLKVAQSGLTPLITAYIAGSNATQTAATGGGGGGGGEGGGSGPTGGVGASSGSNGGANPGANSFGTSNGFTGFSGFGSAGSFSNGGATVTQTIAASASR